MGASYLEKGFVNPPVTAKPWVYWSWMNGNVTKEGITADLEAMQRVGIGGALHINLDIQIPEGPMASFMSPEWRALLQFSASEAHRLGMEMTLYTCDGFQFAGGPWITPETAMKMLVSSQAQAQGPAQYDTVLPQPYTRLDFYHDIAVLAFPTPAGGRVNGPGSGVQITSSFTADLGMLVDGDPNTLAAIPETLGLQPQYIQFEFPEPRNVLAITFHIPPNGLGRGIVDAQAAKGELQVSDDNCEFRSVGSFEMDWDRTHYQTPTVTVSCTPQTARYFRLVISDAHAFDLGEVELLAEPRVHYWEAKAGMARKRQHGGESFQLASGSGPSEGTQYPADTMIRPETIVNLTSQVGADGRLTWDVPAGDWTILRIGFTATGVKNHPATKGGHGLECDKLSPKGIEALFPHIIGRIMDDMKSMPGNVIKYVHSDSWEIGEQNWTEEFAEEFQKRRGYDLLPYLAVAATGRVVGSYAVSDRFLRDFRRTIADLLTDRYHKRLAELCHEIGLEYQSEAAGRQQYMYDAIGYFAKSDVPMGEFWRGHEWYNGVRVDCRAAASVAHTYGKPYVTAEAFTSAWIHSKWTEDPYALKALGDKAFCAGVNRFVFHRYTHQPYEVKPGLQYGPWGIHFERTNTWWEQGRGWVNYLGRCQWLLQQGQFVADVIHYIGDEIPNYLGHRNELWNPVPQGYDYDGCITDLLLQMQYEDGFIRLPSGMKYQVLLLPSSSAMKPEAVRKARDLVQAGAVVIGPKPLRSPSLESYPQCDAEVARLADEVWGCCDGLTVKEHSFGKGKVVFGKSVAEVLAEMGVVPDFAFRAESTDAEISYIHRQADGMDFYLVANGKERDEDIICDFRVAGKLPEMWRPETGEIEKLSVYTETPDGIQARLHLTPSESVWVVFRPSAEKADHVVVVKHNDAPTNAPLLHVESDGAMGLLAFEPGAYELTLASGSSLSTQIDAAGEQTEISGPWEIHFAPDLGAPQKAVFDKLISWPEHSDPGIKYFSGTATYIKEISMPSGMLEEPKAVYLDLGQVKHIAEVEINGMSVGLLWKPPFRVDITSALKPGLNKLVIAITNTWPNRLIGDEQLPDDVELKNPAVRPAPLKRWPDWMFSGQPRTSGRYTLVTWRHYTKDSPLVESGLLGPVILHVGRRVLIKR